MTLRQALVRPSPQPHRASARGAEVDDAGRSARVHVAYQGVGAFRQRHGHLPQLDSQEHAAEAWQLSASFLEKQRVVQLRPNSAPSAS